MLRPQIGRCCRHPTAAATVCSTDTGSAEFGTSNLLPADVTKRIASFRQPTNGWARFERKRLVQKGSKNAPGYRIVRTLTVVPELTIVEDEDSTPIAGRFGSVPKGGDASALANDRPRAVLSIRARQWARCATRVRAPIPYSGCGGVPPSAENDDRDRNCMRCEQTSHSHHHSKGSGSKHATEFRLGAWNRNTKQAQFSVRVAGCPHAKTRPTLCASIGVMCKLWSARILMLTCYIQAAAVAQPHRMETASADDPHAPYTRTGGPRGTSRVRRKTVSKNETGPTEQSPPAHNHIVVSHNDVERIVANATVQAVL